jgi:pimeloyl-[acyl-carrier protein] methyl ester esterase
MMFTPDELSGNSFEIFVRDCLRLTRRPALNAALHTLDSLALADMRRVLSRIDIPVLLVHGDKDRICHPESSRYMAASISHASLSILNGAGHAPMLSRSEDFNSLMARFLVGVYGDY